MKSPILATIVVAALVGGASAFVMGTLTKSETTAGQAPVGPQDTDQSLALEVEKLREQNAKLEDRLAMLEGDMKLVANMRQAVTDGNIPEELATTGLDPQLQAILASLQNPENGVHADFENSVAKAMESIEDKEQAERDAQRAEREAERQEERLTMLKAELGLDDYQAGEMRNIMTDSNQKRTDMRNELRESGDWRSGRELMRTMRDETNAAVGKILSPAQMEKFGEVGGFGGGRGGGFGGGGFGGGGGATGGGGRGRGN